MKLKTTELEVNGEKVVVKLFAPDKGAKKLALLFLHGWTGKPNERAAEVMAKNGFYSLTISMRGHKPSGGDIQKVTAKDSLKDALASYDFLKSQLPEGTQIAAIGNSYGGYIAVILSEQRDLAGLSLRVPAAYPDEQIELPKWKKGHEDEYIHSWRQQPVEFSQNKAFSLVHNFPGQIQIIEAEKDEIVPSQTVRNYVNAIKDKNRLEYDVMKNWPHSLGDHPERNKKFQAILLKWADKVEKELHFNTAQIVNS